MTGQVWYNAIYEEHDPLTDPYTTGPSGIVFVQDFNVALYAYATDPATVAKMNSIKTSQADVAALMTELQNPPKDYHDIYATLTDLFVAYQSLTNFALNPSGSLNTFPGEKSERINNYLNLFTKFSTQLPN